MTPDQILNELAHCTCTDNYYQHWCKHLIYTDGVKQMADLCRAYWLIDAIASYQTVQFSKANEFQVWKLEKSPTKAHPDRYTLTCEDGNGNEIIRQIISYSDFPLDNMTVWVEGGTALLPSEH